jgi:membrane glycosyltransferase
MAVTAAILFLPKFLSVLLLVVKRQRLRSYGGVSRLFASIVVETLLGSLLAPIRMVFHTRFVVQNLLGRTVSWTSQGRDDNQTGWGEALRKHGFDTIFATVWGLGLYWLNPDYFWWVTPIIGALLVSIPLSVMSSRVSVGDAARRMGLFVIPEETDPPQELRDLASILEQEQAAQAALPLAQRNGLERAVVDPYVNALHRALLRRPRRVRAEIRAMRAALVERLLGQGTRALTPREQRIVFNDPDSVDQLHAEVWQLPGHLPGRARE